MSRNIWVGIIIVIALVAGGWWYLNQSSTPAASETTQSPTAQNTNVGTQPNSTPSSNISQLTKTQVLNGYDQCGVQFNNGDISLGYDKYTQLERTCSTAVSGASFSGEKIVFADLDGDGVNEALVPVRIVTGASGGALYVFKNVSGVARAIDSVTFGIQNATVASVDKSKVVVDVEAGMGYSAHQETYKFANGKLAKQ